MPWWRFWRKDRPSANDLSDLDPLMSMADGCYGDDNADNGWADTSDVQHMYTEEGWDADFDQTEMEQAELRRFTNSSSSCQTHGNSHRSGEN